MFQGLRRFTSVLSTLSQFQINKLRRMSTLEDIPPGFAEIKEGCASMLYKQSEEVFYNKIQVFNRDTSIQVINLFASTLLNERKLKGSKKLSTDGITILDALAATGLRSVRYLKEIPLVKHVTINDILPEATQQAQENCIRNKVDPSLFSIHTGDAILLLHSHTSPESRFDVIDLDPYGSAAPFLDGAVQAVSDGGLLCVTCTDMPVLSGNYPEVCFSKYGSMPLKAPFHHEMSLRVLLNALEASANKYKRCIYPWLSLSVDFYVRVFVRVFDSPNEVKRSSLKRGMVFQSNQCSAYYVSPMGVISKGKKSQQQRYGMKTGGGGGGGGGGENSKRPNQQQGQEQQEQDEEQSESHNTEVETTTTSSSSSLPTHIYLTPTTFNSHLEDNEPPGQRPLNPKDENKKRLKEERFQQANFYKEKRRLEREGRDGGEGGGEGVGDDAGEKKKSRDDDGCDGKSEKNQLEEGKEEGKKEDEMREKDMSIATSSSSSSSTVTSSSTSSSLSTSSSPSLPLDRGLDLTWDWSSLFGSCPGVVGDRNSGRSFSASMLSAPPNCPETGGRMRVGGPFWIDPIHDQTVVDELLRRGKEMGKLVMMMQTTSSSTTSSSSSSTPSTPSTSLSFLPSVDLIPSTLPRFLGTLTVIQEELKDVPFYYDLPRLSSDVRSSAPTLLEIRTALNNLSYRFSQFHHEPTAFKTDAPPHIVFDIMRHYCTLHPPASLSSLKHPLPPSSRAILSHPLSVPISFTPTSTTTPLPPSSTSSSSSPTEGDFSSLKITRFFENPETHWGPKRRAGRPPEKEKQTQPKK